MSRLSLTRQTRQRQQSTGGLDSAQVTAITSSNKMSVYSSLDSLPTTGFTTGTKAMVESDAYGNTRLYVGHDAGWYNNKLVNIAPTVDSIAGFSLNSTLNKSDSADYTVIASDSDNANLTYSYVATPSNITDSAITITQDSSVFTIAVDSATTSDGFNLVFRASDGINIGTSSKDFTITQAIQRNITPYHIATYSGGLGSGIITPSFEFREDQGYRHHQMDAIATELTNAIQAANSYTFPAENPAYAVMYLTCWDSSSAVYVAKLQRNNVNFFFPAIAYTYNPDSADGNDGLYAAGRISVGVGVDGDLFPSDTHYHRADTESIADSDLTGFAFSRNNYVTAATSTTFDDGSGSSTYYSNVGVDGEEGGTATGSAPTFREIRLYAESANTNNLIWSAPMKY